MDIPFNAIYNYITKRCLDLKIDESHAVKHSMDVLKYSQKILNEELKIEPELYKYSKIIYTSAMLHDMCDSKYMNEIEGINDIKNFLKSINYCPKDIEIISKIIGTMSYSKVKKKGFPDLGEYMRAYHIVRESDLLAGYDIERCIVYGMIGRNFEYIESFLATEELYKKRMGKQIEDKLFTTSYALNEAEKLDSENKNRLKELKTMLFY